MRVVPPAVPWRRRRTVHVSCPRGSGLAGAGAADPSRVRWDSSGGVREPFGESFDETAELIRAFDDEGPVQRGEYSWQPVESAELESDMAYIEWGQGFTPLTCV